MKSLALAIASGRQRGDLGRSAELQGALRRAWSAVTSSSTSWRPTSPSAGQCAVTALVVQDFLGGDLLRAVVSGESHYWNRLPDGNELDLTVDQFASYHLEEAPEVRERSYVLGFSDTRRRYQILRNQVESLLGPDHAAVLS